MASPAACFGAFFIDETEWTSLGVDVKAEAYEGLLEKAASEGKKGAGQYFTPRRQVRYAAPGTLRSAADFFGSDDFDRLFVLRALQAEADPLQTLAEKHRMHVLSIRKVVDDLWSDSLSAESSDSRCQFTGWGVPLVKASREECLLNSD